MAYHCCGKWNCAEHHNGILSKKTVTMPYLTLFQIYILSLNKKRGGSHLDKEKSVQGSTDSIYIAAYSSKGCKRAEQDTVR